MDQDPHMPCVLRLTPRRAGLLAGQGGTVDVLLQVKAADAPAETSADTPPGATCATPWRPPLALALVIDCSGSMAGEPLDLARQGAEFVLSRLRASDRVALVRFDGGVQRLWPAAPLGDGRALRLALAGLTAGAGSDLHAGWQEAVWTLAETLPQDSPGLRRVILLSDGEATQGLTDAAQVVEQCRTWAAQGIGTSTCGVGPQVNETLLQAMARAGGGSSSRGDTVADLMAPLEHELALVDNLCLRRLRLAVQPPAGVQLEWLDEPPGHEDGRPAPLPDLAWGAEAWAVLRLKLPAARVPASGQRLALLRVDLQATGPAGQALTLSGAALTLPVLDAAAHAALAEDEGVWRRLCDLAAARQLERVRRAARQGARDEVERLLDEAVRQFGGHDGLDTVLQALHQGARRRESGGAGRQAPPAARPAVSSPRGCAP